MLADLFIIKSGKSVRFETLKKTESVNHVLKMIKDRKTWESSPFASRKMLLNMDIEICKFCAHLDSRFLEWRRENGIPAESYKL